MTPLRESGRDAKWFALGVVGTELGSHSLAAAWLLGVFAFVVALLCFRAIEWLWPNDEPTLNPERR